jgi:hypothetical protein
MKMKKVALLFLSLFLLSGLAFAAEQLEYFQVYKPEEGMSADDIMRIEYFVKYTLFARDATFDGKAYFVDKGGSTREKETQRKRITFGWVRLPGPISALPSSRIPGSGSHL